MNLRSNYAMDNWIRISFFWILTEIGHSHTLSEVCQGWGSQVGRPLPQSASSPFTVFPEKDTYTPGATLGGEYTLS